LLLLAQYFLAMTADAASSNAAGEATVSGLIVKFDRASAARTTAMGTPSGRAAAMAARASQVAGKRVRMSFDRELATQAELLLFDAPRPLSEAEAMARSVSALPGVLYASPNRKMFTQAVPLDPEYYLQWGFRLNTNEQGANFEAAWERTKGDPNQTIGVIDSGVARAHPELATQLRLHPLFPNGGYDFMKNPLGAGDGDGRDDNPEQSPNACGHGSHVSGTIAANTKFSGGGVRVGVAGGAPLSKVLMARALDFTGDEADVIDAMLWLSGATVPGVAVNPNPVRVINMSLGGAGGCGAGYADAVEQLAARGVLVVAAAGNSASDVSNFAPASCAGVVAVAASTVNGNRASFSNFGAGVTLTAPGDGVYSTGGSEGENCYKSGTSMAAPHVTAAVALLHSIRPNLSANQTILALRAGTRAFPMGGNCTTSSCGAGLLDAANSLARVETTATATVGWTSGAQSVRENDGSVTLSLARIGSTSAPASIDVVAIAGSATAGVDFGAPTPSVVSWSAGDVQDKSVTIPITYRTGEQGARSFSVNLANASGVGTLVAPTDVPIRITEVDCNTVTPVAIGGTATGTLGMPLTTYCRGGVRGPEYDTVRYSFQANAGDVISIALDSTTASPGVLDPYAYLLNSDLQIVTENDDIVAGVQRNARIELFSIPASGTYYIDATTWSATTDRSGTYELRLTSCGAYVGGASCNLDVDGDRMFDANDAATILRRMLGYADAPLRAGIDARACASRTEASAIASFIDSQLVPQAPQPLAAYDLDGDGRVSATTDGLILLRAALGFADPAAEATAPSATRTQWSAIKAYLESSCGALGFLLR
jgi:serine protease